MSGLEARRLDIPDVIVVTPPRFGDARGYFSETYSKPKFAELGIACEFVQDNQSRSAAPGTLRGLHFQHGSAAQAKLVRCLRGSIYDVAVDIRRSSPTYGKWVAAEISEENGAQIFVPRGFAHAFLTLEPGTEVAYKVDNLYDAKLEAGIRWDDPDLAIDWPLPTPEPILSEKDAINPPFARIPAYF